MKTNRSSMWHLGAVLAGLVGACGENLPRPPAAPQTTDAYVEVPEPPPPARVETVTPRPDGAAVWIDGQWTFRGRSWRWKPGGWVIPPPGARFARWVTVYGSDGTLYFAPAVWKDADGKVIAAPAFVGSTSAGSGNAR